MPNASRRRAAAAARAVRRDSTGKSVGAPVSAERESPPLSCDLLGQPAGKEVFMQSLPPREPRERYLGFYPAAPPLPCDHDLQRTRWYWYRGFRTTRPTHPNGRWNSRQTEYLYRAVLRPIASAGLHLAHGTHTRAVHHA